MSERVTGKLLYSSPDYIRDVLRRQMPRVLRGHVPELGMVSEDVVEAMVISLIDGANRDQREVMYHMVLERMHRTAVGSLDASGAVAWLVEQDDGCALGVHGSRELAEEHLRMANRPGGIVPLVRAAFPEASDGDYRAAA